MAWTWKQFKDAIEDQGIDDNTEIRHVDWEDSCYPKVSDYANGQKCVDVDFDDDVEEV